MIVTNLHFKRSNSSTFYSLKFTAGKNNLRSTWAISGTDLHPQWILLAIKELFVENHTNNFDKIILETSDDAGDSIVITKDNCLISIYKNGLVINKKNFLQTIFESQENPDSQLTKDYRVFISELSQERCFSAKEESASINNQKFALSTERKIIKLKREIDNLLNVPTNKSNMIDFDMLKTICNSNSSYQYSLHEKSEIEPKASHHQPNVGDVETARKKYELIIQIESIFKPMSHQLENFEKNEKLLDFINKKIIELKSDTKLNYSLITKNKNEFSKCFRILARIEIIKNILSIIDKKRNDLIGHIKIPFENARNRVNNIDTNSFTSLLEKLAKLKSFSIAQRFPVKKSTEKNQTWFEKFKIINNGEKIDSSNIDLLTDIEKFSSEVIIDIDEIKNDLCEKSYNSENIEDEFEILYSAYLERLGEVKSQWNSVAKNINATKITNTVKFTEFFQKANSLVGYTIQKRALEKIQLSHGKILDSIKAKVLQWRELNKSIKSNPIKSKGELLQEAKSILRYKDTITKKYETLTRDHIKSQYLEERILELDQIISVTEEKWRRIFDGICDNYPKLNNSLIGELKQKLVLLDLYSSQKIEAENKDTIKPFSHTGALFSTWNFGNISIQSEDINNIKSLLNQSGLDECRIITSEQKDIISSLHKVGCGRVIEVPGVVDLEKLYHQLGIQRSLLSSEELNAINSSHLDAKPTPTLEKIPNYETPTLDLDINEDNILKARKIQQTLNILNGHHKK